MNKELIQFIELCLIDGVITEKERKVIFKKAAAFGVDEDECHVILEAYIHKASKNKTATTVHRDESKKIIDNNEVDTDLISILKPVRYVIDKNELRGLYNASIESKIDYLIPKITELETKKIALTNRFNEVHELQLEFDKLSNKRSRLLEDIKKLKSSKDVLDDINIIEELAEEFLKLGLKRKGNKWFTSQGNVIITENKFQLFSIKKSVFGPKKGELVTKNYSEINSLNNLNDFYLEISENDILLKTLEIIKNKIQVYESVNSEKRLAVRVSIDEIQSKLTILSHRIFTKKKEVNKFREESKLIINKLNTFKKQRDTLISQKDEKYFKRHIQLCENAILVYQSGLFKKLILNLEIENQEQILNLTRFCSFIEKAESNYTNTIKGLHDSSNERKLIEEDLAKLLELKQYMLTLYNSFYLMYQCLLEGRMGAYMDIYVKIDDLGVFDSAYEKKVLENLIGINLNLENINSSLLVTNKLLSENNEYLELLNDHMYNLNVNVGKINTNLSEIDSNLSSIHSDITLMSQDLWEMNDLLTDSLSELKGINSGVSLNNLLIGYNSYRINKLLQ